MRFELGKTYIVEVTENGIIPTEEFNEEHYYDKDHDDLDFLTDEEKAVVVIQALEDVRAEIEEQIDRYDDRNISEYEDCLAIIDRKIAEVKGDNEND